MDCLACRSFSYSRLKATAKRKLSVPLKPPTPAPFSASSPSAFFELLHYDIRKLIYKQLLSLTSKSTLHISSCYLSGHQKLVAVPCFTKCQKPHRGDSYEQEPDGEESPGVPKSQYGDFSHPCLLRMQWERGNEPRNVLGIWGALLTCRQMHSEIMSLIYTNFSFGITYLHTLNRFVNISSPSILNSIQHLQLKWDMKIYIWPGRDNARIDTLLFPNRTFLRKSCLSAEDIILEVKQPLALQQWEAAWRKIAQMAALRTVEVMMSWEDRYAHDSNVPLAERKMFEALLGIGQEIGCEANESWADGTVVSVEKGNLMGWMSTWPSSIFILSRQSALSGSGSDPTMTSIKQYYEKWYSTDHNTGSRGSLAL